MANELVEVKADNKAMANELVEVKADYENQLSLFMAEIRGQKAMEQQHKMTR
ncbi:hypothetical protein AMATHDRAFT_7633 [Amanita thiersii Skay4041]|uniref:Uncharacterized protein n=1 Tax=Amanita thiersii Skay4041 TaxID=703135 RepID=A0A2A9NFU5_9AGAR|nr:hypothetical protein AMATHDRAFT_7633 [Amanita thiersii Skay4041]